MFQLDQWSQYSTLHFEVYTYRRSLHFKSFFSIRELWSRPSLKVYDSETGNSRTSSLPIHPLISCYYGRFFPSRHGLRQRAHPVSRQSSHPYVSSRSIRSIHSATHTINSSGAADRARTCENREITYYGWRTTIVLYALYVIRLRLSCPTKHSGSHQNGIFSSPISFVLCSEAYFSCVIRNSLCAVQNNKMYNAINMALWLLI